MSIILNTTLKEYYCSSTNGFGFKVLLHSPNELPEIEYYGLGIANGYESRIVATPIVSTSSGAIRNIPVDIRKCLFEDENSLKLYRYEKRSTISKRTYFFHCKFTVLNIFHRFSVYILDG